MPAESLAAVMVNIASAFPGEPVTVAVPDTTIPADLAGSSRIRLIPYTPTVPSHGAWVFTAADYLNTFQLAREHHANLSLMLGLEAQSLHPRALRNLASAIGAGTDLAVPHYTLRPREGLVNAALLYPVTRALFGANPRFPLAIDLGLSFRAIEHLATGPPSASPATGQSDAVVWPVAEAAATGLSIAEVEAGERTLPSPPAG